MKKMNCYGGIFLQCVELIRARFYYIEKLSGPYSMFLYRVGADHLTITQRKFEKVDNDMGKRRRPLLQVAFLERQAPTLEVIKPSYKVEKLFQCSNVHFIISFSLFVCRFLCAHLILPHAKYRFLFSRLIGELII